MRKDERDNESAKRRRRIMIIILIILLLLLITSCTYLGRRFGRIGDEYNNTGSFVIDDDTEDLERIKNRELVFDDNDIKISSSNKKYKLSYSYTKINPTKFTCKTSDANIATCYVEDGYVVIVPKKPGKVTITLETQVNDKIYEAETDVTITDEIKKYISLSSTKGEIDLAYTNEKKVAFTLVGLKGTVKVTTSDKAVADAIVSNGIITIKAKAKGTVKITVYLGDYKATYTLTVKDSRNEGATDDKPVIDAPDKELDKNNYLSSIKSDYPLNEVFYKNKNDYSMDVPYNKSSLNIEGILDSNKSKVQYKINGVVTDNKNIPLKDGNNKLEIIVTAENGDMNTYIINIHKPVRSIAFEKSEYSFIIDGKEKNLIYSILEDSKETNNYDINDIKVSFINYSGTYNLEKGNIKLIPDESMVGKTATMKVTYNNKETIVKVSFKLDEYYLYSYPSGYTISLKNGYGYKNLIFNTNIFDEEFIVENIENGIRLKTRTNDKYIDITSSSSLIRLSSASNDYESIVVKAEANAEASAIITATGYVYGVKINEVSLMVESTNKSVVRIDANGGFFNELTDVLEFLVSEDETIDLSEYNPLKVDESGNCMYFELKEYNTKADGSGTPYNKDTVLSNITDDLTLYAIYNDTSVYMELKDNKKLYLTDVPLFHNEEYLKKYGEDKVIYPGAHGAYVMMITNSSSSDLKITGITLEEDTICIPNKGCLNMGYKLRYAKPNELYKYFYGSSNSYTILNKDGLNSISSNYTKKDIVFSDSINLDKGSSAEITLFWEWVSENDELDTLVGEMEVNPNDEYTLTVSINFDTDNRYCKK